MISMSDPFIICIDRLKNGAVQKLDSVFPSDFIDVDEPDLHFHDAVQVKGEAYLTDDDLVLHFSASTIARMKCCVCNQTVPFTISVKGFYHTAPLSEIRDPLFDFRSVLREALLIELPKVTECKGNCPERESMRPYLHQESKTDASTHYFPFNDLKLP
jgi:uncharacterized metal-binding protein YceD (DUF177 family)